MEFNCKVNIVDAIMGSGKTCSIINYINSHDDQCFLVITPYLDEIERYKMSCPNKNFKTPHFNKNQSKLDDLKKLIGNGENIVSTHALFSKFDNELIDICRANNYTLIMDEVANVVEEYPLTKYDLETLKENYVNINEDTKQLIWRPECENYHGRFEDEKRLCNLGSLVCYGDCLMMWLFPIEAFNSFRNIFILTYKFGSQLQKYYYDYYKLPYKYLSVAGDSVDNYHLIEYDEDVNYIQYDYKSLIHICKNEKLNLIGEDKHSLCKNWYEKNDGTQMMTVLKNNIYNFFNNIRNSNSNDNIWTTYKNYKHQLKGNRYTKGFLPINCRATNEFKNRTSVAYMVNIFLKPYVKNFFTTNNIQVDEDGYALSEMLQFIWRSAIREGKEIWVYIPSIRMRKLLEKWIEENPLPGGVNINK